MPIVGTAVERIADRERLQRLDEASLELPGDVAMDDEALRRDAALTVVDRPRLDRSFRNCRRRSKN